MSALRQIGWNERLSPRENARRELPCFVASYFAYVRKALAGDPQPAALHRLRLATKQLRYTLELFRGFYGPGLEERLGMLRTVQQRLGEVNDAVASWNLLSKKLGRTPGANRVHAFLDARAQSEARQFRREWKRLFETPGREAWWTEYLAGKDKRLADRLHQHGHGATTA
jgi:CHAD domain-containing protein